MISLISAANLMAQIVMQFVLCHTAISSEPLIQKYPSQMIVCLDVVQEAESQQVEVPVMVALAWSESRFQTDKVSTAGAFGPLQVTKFWCPGNCKDPVEAGVRAMRTLKKMKGNTELALCHYACGNICYPTGKKYAKYIQRAAKKISRR
jgi:hypothetical protein